MSPRLRCERHADAASFLAAAGPWLDRDAVANNVVSTVAFGRASGVLPEPEGALWMTIVDGFEVVGAVLHTPPHPLLLSRLSLPAVDAAAEELLRTRGDLVGVNGPKAPVERFAAQWSARTGRPWVTAHQNRLFDVDQVHPPVGVTGRARRADLDDLDLLAVWESEFHREAGPDQPFDPQQHRAAMRRRLQDSRPYWLWEAEGEPTSMLAESAPAGGVVRLQLVYTPPAMRGHGFASACVAEVSAQVLARPPVKACTLYADLANPTSNKIYQRIGYRPVLDAVSVRFDRDAD